MIEKDFKIYKTNPKFLVLPIFGGKSGVVKSCPDMGLYQP